MIDRVLGLVPSWVYVVVIAALVALLGIQWATTSAEISGLKVELAKAQKKHSDYVAEQTRLNKEATDKTRKRELELQAAADKERTKASVQINRLSAERDAALAELRKRPKRPAAAANPAVVPSPAGPGPEAQHCTGAELYRDDAAFLVRLSADYKQLGIEYDRIWSLYERARTGSQAADAVSQ